MSPDLITDNVRLALAEDIGQGDVTAALTPADVIATAAVTVKQDAVICGIDWFEATFRQLDEAMTFGWNCLDGDGLATGSEVCRLEGHTRAILTGERTALNFLQTLSATATAARRFVDAVDGTGVTILDTRKTIPGLRSAQKYAVRCGGASNHRSSLFDAVLIKENHIAAIGSIDEAIARIETTAGSALVEIEVENLNELKTALESSADRLMLDDFSIDTMREAVALRDRIAPAMKLEASGSVTLDNVRAIAATGVDYISVGLMTKSIDAVDFSLRVIEGS